MALSLNMCERSSVVPDVAANECGKNTTQECGKTVARRCACVECRNVTGHSGVSVTRCLNVFVPSGEEQFCKHCSLGHCGNVGEELECECPCWGHNPGAHVFRPEKGRESLLTRMARLRRRRRRARHRSRKVS